MKSAILGGSFDPVHLGHLKLAAAVLEHTAYERVIFVPAGMPPHKSLSEGATDSQRLEMLELAIDGHPGMIIWDGELRRPGKSYTIDTVRQLKAEGFIDGRPALIIGEDLLAGLPSWHRGPELLDEVEVILANRGGFAGEELPFRPLALNNDVWPYSSTEVRQRIADHAVLSETVTQAVAAYIVENGLYGHEG